MFRRKGPSEIEVARENEIKLAITQELSKALKDVQRENVGTEDQAVYSTETANAVCTCLEAILLHGLKAKTVNKIASYMGMGQQALSQPSLNFWNFAAKFTHSEVISQLKHLGQITTEIGLCRAWVRVALNDCLMESYIDSMVADKRTLEYFYHRTAYLRDSEQPEIMKTLLHGLMTFQFKLSYNASVLNQWSYRPLILSGVIDPKEAPPPIIKPTGARPQSSKSDIDPGQRSESVNHSKGTRKSKLKNRQSDNPMDQRQFGQPNNDSYYVTSSEFTSKDVENFKRLGRNSESPLAKSECSSSSRVSCPDPPTMNASPATYVPHRLSARQSEASMDMHYGSPVDYSGNPGLAMYDDNFSEKGDKTSNTSIQDASVPESEINQYSKTLNNSGMNKVPSDVNFPPVSQPPEELLNDIYSELHPTSDSDKQLDMDTSDKLLENDKPGLEESWEEFYRSPDKPNNSGETGYKQKYQRLESFTQEIKEKAIISDFNDVDTADNKDGGVTAESESDGFCVNIYGKDDSEIDSKTKANVDDNQDAIEDGNKTSNDATSDNQHSDWILNDSVEAPKVVDSTIQKAVKEDVGDSSSLLTESNLKILEEELSNYVEEKIVIDNQDTDAVAHKPVSPVKKKKKSSASMNKLKPPLSLSPQRQGALTPELSDAIADEINTIPISDDKDYLKKHRMSLPALSAINSSSTKHGHRQSMPNLTENIEDDLLKEIYDGIPLDNDKDDVNNDQEVHDILDEVEDKARQSTKHGHRQSMPDLTENIEDDLLKEIYDGIPLDNDKDDVNNDQEVHDILDEVEDKVRQSTKHGHRQSMPNLTENIEDDLLKEIYDGIPLDNDKDDVNNDQEVHDILDEVEDKARQRLPLPAISAINSSSTKHGHRQSMPNLTENIEEDLLKEIYDGIPLDNDKDDVNNDQEVHDILDEVEDKARQRHVTDETRPSVGNSLMSGRGWSSSFDSELGDTVDALVSSPKVPGSLPIRPKTESFGSLLQNYTPASSIGARSIDDILHNFPQSVGSETMSPQSTGLSSPDQGADNLDDFEVVMETKKFDAVADNLDDFEVVMDTEKFDANDMDRLTHIAEIVNEKGLDAQNFQCKGCQRAVGMIFGKPRVCKFDGGYYCYECHENDEYYIPALIVHNWDFRKHKVSKKNLEFLQEIEEQPCINLELSNSRLYEHVPEMQDIKALRTQLIYLKSYLFTCKQSVAEDLRRLVWPRDYLFENTEEYSLADLLQVPTGALASSLKKTIRFCTKHVYSCRLCSQKGFICELCHNPKVIYPFEIDSTYRCSTCKSVFHKECKTDNRPCPKCQRRLRRESTHGMVETPTAVDYAFVS